jgi:OmpA-OmpF porin, OOP family
MRPGLTLYLFLALTIGLGLAPEEAISLSPSSPLSFVFHFDFNSADLSPESPANVKKLVSEANDWLPTGQYNRILLVGHTDRSGSDAYNIDLGERRAEAVRDALISAGIPSGQIVIQSLGEMEPAAPTRDGVAEPYNRRVEARLVSMY